MSDNVGFQIFPFSAETWLGKMTLRLAIYCERLSMGILYTTAAYAPAVKGAREGHGREAFYMRYLMLLIEIAKSWFTCLL